MIVTPIKTHKITGRDRSITKILDRYVTRFPEKSVLVVTSKIVSICKRSIIPMGSTTREALAEQESQLYIPKEYNKYGFTFTIANSTLIASAGIDESNGNGHFVLWPKNPHKSANTIRQYLVKRFVIKHAGVIIVDTHTTPFRWGLTGIHIGYSGFVPLKNLIGTPDLFGRLLKVSKQSIVDGLAASASVTMGEGAEQTPLALITNVPFVEFQDRNPTKEELHSIRITPEEDLYWPVMKNAPWKKGGKK